MLSVFATEEARVNFVDCFILDEKVDLFFVFLDVIVGFSTDYNTCSFRLFARTIVKLNKSTRIISLNALENRIENSFVNIVEFYIEFIQIIVDDLGNQLFFLWLIRVYKYIVGVDLTFWMLAN